MTDADFEEMEHQERLRYDDKVKEIMEEKKMTDEELWLKHIEEYPQIKSWSEEKREGARKGFKSGLAEGRKDLEKENAELKAQIEKMKCCENCKHGNQHYYFEPCKNCGGCNKWEITE